MTSGLLTRKQCWRRQSTSGRRGNDFLYFKGVGDDGNFPTFPTDRSSSEPKNLGSLLDIFRLGRLWATTGDLKLAVKNKVRFQPAVSIILIPSRKEFINANLIGLMWWDDTDYSSFKSLAVSELKQLMKIKSIFKEKEAMKILYQPEYHEEIPCEDLNYERNSDTDSEADSDLDSDSDDTLSPNIDEDYDVPQSQSSSTKIENISLFSLFLESSRKDLLMQSLLSHYSAPLSSLAFLTNFDLASQTKNLELFQ